MKRKSCFYSAVFAGLLCSGISHAQYTNYGSLTLTLSGIVDIVRNPSATVPHYVPGTLTGQTSWWVSPIYTENRGNPWNWRPGDPWTTRGSDLLMITNNTVACDNRSFVTVPGTSVSTLPLSNTANRNQQIYMIPALNYRMTFRGTGWSDTVYTGSFGTQSNELYNRTNYCYVPNNKPVWFDGTKYLTLTSPGTYPVYVPKSVTAGNYFYYGDRLSVIFSGIDYDSQARADLNIITNIKVIRVCQISNVANSNFDVVMGRDNQVLKESSFSFTCTGDGQQMYLSAIAVEGQADSVDPTKLLLNPVSGGTTTPTGRPWVIGKAYVNTSGPAVTCKDTSSSGLIPFNNSDLQLPLKAKVDQIYNMTIKWAICANDQTTPGSYRGRTQVSVFTKL